MIATERDTTPERTRRFRFSIVTTTRCGKATRVNTPYRLYGHVRITCFQPYFTNASENKYPRSTCPTSCQALPHEALVVVHPQPYGIRHDLPKLRFNLNRSASALRVHVNSGPMKQAKAFQNSSLGEDTTINSSSTTQTCVTSSNVSQQVGLDVGCPRVAEEGEERQMVGVDPDVGSSEFSKFPQPECTCPPHSVTPSCLQRPI
ncbi:hypothetical protein KM043_016312 [Ampulex compressa]|nr:hypothetical protein KM043_016312 [Ampulex compressa]